MDALHSRFGMSSAWQIFPLGMLAGAVVVLVPLLTYLTMTQPTGISVDIAVFMIGAFSVVLAFMALLLVFLWLAEWLTEESGNDERAAGSASTRGPGA